MVPVELFVRSEQLQIADAGGSSASVGTIAAQVYPGGLVDLYIDSEEFHVRPIAGATARPRNNDSVADRGAGEHLG